MTQFNPLAPVIAGSSQAQRMQSSDKVRRAREKQQLAKNVAARTDEYEHTVENTEELSPANDGHSSPDQRKRPKKDRPTSEQNEETGDAPGLDLTV
jgi:hypothetical protein